MNTKGVYDFLETFYKVTSSHYINCTIVQIIEQQ